MELQAPASWQCVDFISDLHLHASQRPTFVAWRDYLTHTTADAVFLLGDLFEAWVGDDVVSAYLDHPDHPAPPNPSFENECVAVLRDAAARVPIFIMQGNRDFLMGPALMQACACTAVDDPTVLTFAQQRWLLTHGDALCLDDTAYLQFRAQVRTAQWQAEFLAQSLDQRQEQVRQLRAQSESIKRSTAVYADVDTAAAHASLQAAQASTMIHGHTHRPGQHALGGGCQRLVLSDWDLGAQPPRAEVLRIRLVQKPRSKGVDADGPGNEAVVERISPAQACAATGSKSAD